MNVIGLRNAGRERRACDPRRGEACRPMKPRDVFRRSAILSVIVGLSHWAAPAPALAQASFTDSERRAIDRMIHDYIMNNPEVVLESVQRMRAREQAADEEKRREILAGLRPDLERDPGSHVGGNPDGDIAVVPLSIVMPKHTKCPEALHEAFHNIFSNNYPEVWWVMPLLHSWL